MKKITTLLILILSLYISTTIAQEKKEIVIKTEASEATVFINGAQILRKKSIDLLPGKNTLRFTNLSPYIDAKSVQIKMDGEVMVVSVNHQTNYLDSLPTALNNKEKEKLLEEIQDKITTETTNREVINEELNFLNENKKIGGSNTGVSLATLRETANYYRERTSALKTQSVAVSKKIQSLEREKNAILNDQRQQGNTKKEPIGEVVVEVECKRAVRANTELSYYVNNAGWYPTYDIRAIDINKPIELVYKANIRQNTKEDWKNVKLKISSADPNLGNIAPTLKTYFLNYYTAPPRYTMETGNNKATGVVRDQYGELLVGVSILVEGTTIGAITDIDGRFSISVPQNARNLTFSYIGFEPLTLPITKSLMNVVLKESAHMLDEVVVAGHGTQKKLALTGAVAGVQTTPARSAPKTYERKDIAMPTAQVENQTAVEFEIKIPYTIKSDNKNTLVEVDRYELPADYEYYCIPKVNKDAFLLANIVDWEKYNLLEGEANIFFENTYIGKTILDTRYVSDTLNISLGRDKNIIVTRDKVKDLNTKKFFGNKKEDTRTWKISAKNNKSQPINMVILDQVPVSTTTEIEVETENISKGALDPETGEVKWRMVLKPADKKEFELKYKVKYPKSRILTIE